MRTFPVVVFFLFCLSLGLYVNNRSWNGLVYVYVGEQRSPAAVRTLGDYSAIDHKALYRSVQSQLLAYAQIYKDEGMLGVQLGHPILTAKNGGREFGCQVQDHTGVYDRMQMTFVGTGISEGGEAPNMVIDSRCSSQRDLNQLETVWIPMKELMKSTPKDQQIDYGGENDTKLSFVSIPNQWPENWVLWTVRFYRADTPEEALVIDAAKLKQGRAKLLSFDWQNN